MVTQSNIVLFFYRQCLEALENKKYEDVQKMMIAETLSELSQYSLCVGRISVLARSQSAHHNPVVVMCNQSKIDPR